MRGEDFFTRHSTKPKDEDPESSEFSGISEKGVELAKERAGEILANLEKQENGTVMLISGVSEMPRTKSTAMIYGQEIKNIIELQKIDDVLVFLPEDLGNIDGYTNKVNFLIEQIKANPNKKIVLDFPLFIKELSFKDRWADEEGNLSEYTKQLLERNSDDDEEAMKDWFDNQGRIDDLIGPNPTEVAEQQLAGIERLREFAKKYISDRPLVIGSVGHSWSLDAVAVYLANNGEINKESFEKMKAKMIGETKMIKLSERDGKQVLEYGDLVIPLEK
ncbi:hypothetical protein CL629_01520 [bacterium]|nr:hypothetical protein [bacterium]